MTIAVDLGCKATKQTNKQILFEEERAGCFNLILFLLSCGYPCSSSGFIQANMSKIQGLFKDFSRLSYTFQGLKFYEKS